MIPCRHCTSKATWWVHTGKPPYEKYFVCDAHLAVPAADPGEFTLLEIHQVVDVESLALALTGLAQAVDRASHPVYIMPGAVEKSGE